MKTFSVINKSYFDWPNPTDFEQKQRCKHQLLGAPHVEQLTSTSIEAKFRVQTLCRPEISQP